MGVNTYESQLTRTNGEGLTSSNIWDGQTFTPTLGYAVYQIQLSLSKVGSPPSTTVDIYATNASHEPTGSTMGTATILASAISTSPTYSFVVASFSAGVVLTAGVEYCYIVKCTGATGANSLLVGYNASAGYSAGNKIVTVNAGASWTQRTAWDGTFKIQGYPSSAPPASDSYTTKRLVCCASDEVWLETAGGGTMEQVAASMGLLDTSDFLSMFELYGKAFIVNRSIKKILDLVNTKITTTDAGANPPDFGTVLTGVTSTAKMIVDYTTALVDNAAATIYGKRTTTTTFSSGETVTGTDDDGNAISFVTSAAETAPPHFYDWTVWGGSSVYGALADNLTLGCAYRGRAVVSGDPLHPHQWYMSRVFNPWNFIYGANNPLSAVAGNNTNAGEVGDIITALIPYGDDFLVFGGSHSISILDGDPCQGGSIDQIDDTAGIYGPSAWCKDNSGNLYFFGSGGLYRMDGGRSKPQNISYGSLPELVDEWAAAPATHRIILTYDPLRHGILITRTTLASGANLNYWYDLKAVGFYPETYPNACGIFSSHNYNSNAAATRKTIFGCSDGYLRYSLDTAKDDDSGLTDTAINSYCTLPLIKMNEADDSEGRLISLTFELAGGAASGTFGDTDGLTYEIHVGDDAETVLEDIKDGATAFSSGTLSGTGRKNRIRVKARGRWLGIKLYNSTAAQTWAINTVNGTIAPAGKIKG